jgi:hypothetical protein
VGRNFLKLTLALMVLTGVFLMRGSPPSASRVATDSAEMAAGRAYASPDGVSTSWKQGEGTEDLIIYALASHPESSRVYAGTWGEGVYYAESGENSWPLPPIWTPWEIAALAIDPVNPVILYAGTMENGIQRSTNGGDNWGPTTGLSQEVWSLAVSSTYAYAGTAGEIYTSTNGTDWDLAGGTEIGTEKFYALAVDPRNSQIAYAGTNEKGVHRTIDGGATWELSGTELAAMTVRALAIHPGNSNIIYAGTLSNGLFKSIDGGASWPLSELDEYGVLAIAINPRDPEFVYAGTWGGGVWVSDDGGHKWRRTPGLTEGASYIFSLTLFSPEGEDEDQVLYAGTKDGVWARAVAPFCISYLPLVYKQ